LSCKRSLGDFRSGISAILSLLILEPAPSTSLFPWQIMLKVESVQPWLTNEEWRHTSYFHRKIGFKPQHPSPTVSRYAPQTRPRSRIHRIIGPDSNNVSLLCGTRLNIGPDDMALQYLTHQSVHSRGSDDGRRNRAFLLPITVGFHPPFFPGPISSCTISTFCSFASHFRL
jgi:hypothetical protein